MSETAERSCSECCHDAWTVMVQRAVVASSRHARLQRPECPASTRSASAPRARRSEYSQHQSDHDQVEADNAHSQGSSTADGRGTATPDTGRWCRLSFI